MYVCEDVVIILHHLDVLCHSKLGKEEDYLRPHCILYVEMSIHYSIAIVIRSNDG